MKSNIKSLGVITMELIQGYVKEDGRVGLDSPQGWSLGMDFLVATESTSKISVLMKVRAREGIHMNLANYGSIHCCSFPVIRVVSWDYSLLYTCGLAVGIVILHNERFRE